MSDFVCHLAMGTLLVASSLQVCAQGGGNTSFLAPRQFAAIAHSTGTHEFILFGGTEADGTVTTDETWVWSGKGLNLQMPTRHPESRIFAGIAYDNDRREVVLFGGTDEHSRRTTSTPWVFLRKYPDIPLAAGTQAFYGDTWIWDGKDWTQRNPSQAPSERDGQEMAYDAARKQVVLFGGVDEHGGKYLNETWVWDGSNWKMMKPINVPPGRHLQAMAYDPDHQQIVMFGGMTTGERPLDDTWIWDGSDWKRAEPSGTLPEARFEAGMGYDPIEKKIVLISGDVMDSSGGGSPANDAWTWDGSDWKKLARLEFEQISDFSKFNPRDADRALIVNASSTPVIWVPTKRRF
jgi:hypothetical protein